MQRLNWLEEAQRIAYQSGAWQKLIKVKRQDLEFPQLLGHYN